MDKWMNGYMDGWIIEWMDEWMYGWIDGRMGEWINGYWINWWMGNLFNIGWKFWTNKFKSIKNLGRKISDKQYIRSKGGFRQKQRNTDMRCCNSSLIYYTTVYTGRGPRASFVTSQVVGGSSGVFQQFVCDPTARVSRVNWIIHEFFWNVWPNFVFYLLIWFCSSEKITLTFFCSCLQI